MNKKNPCCLLEFYTSYKHVAALVIVKEHVYKLNRSQYYKIHTKQLYVYNMYKYENRKCFLLYIITISQFISKLLIGARAFGVIKVGKLKCIFQT